jgi:uncharacterized protein (DUF4415 family)
MKEKGITRIAFKDLHKIKSLTDWKRVDALTDEDIEKAVAEDPDTWIPTKEEWASARIVWPEGKEPIAIRLDRDIVQWFGDRGLDYRAKINAVLREYVEAQKPPKRTARSASVVTKKHPRKGARARFC